MLDLSSTPSTAIPQTSRYALGLTYPRLHDWGRGVGTSQGREDICLGSGGVPRSALAAGRGVNICLIMKAVCVGLFLRGFPVASPTTTRIVKASTPVFEKGAITFEFFFYLSFSSPVSLFLFVCLRVGDETWPQRKENIGPALFVNASFNRLVYQEGGVRENRSYPRVWAFACLNTTPKS